MKLSAPALPTPITQQRKGFLPHFSSPLSVVSPIVQPTAIPSALHIELRDLLNKVIKKQEDQDQLMKTIYDNMAVKTPSSYNGPEFMAAEEVNQLAESNPSDSSFIRVLLDTVCLPSETGKKVQERDRMRTRFAQEVGRFVLHF
ncbi:hypothetical protein PMAYCL1PPCAC_31374 [Pristionchus mayeri]|uniref:Uncharacterized protein n=1 Tax=Pristionchus mayeri TaxID=1317129 RepID=A0AAN5DG48_9BILA|nr:hypothetical protein PMAYCL1PPCAC_04453 [Pristionchus mayeri]GMR49897.1 hypothetical protein PMAYCL1PPCAC_20092 [Pristionchus mayeri]GMR51768.1 hypothetical protein PMAYCL1PPCAC_21963 [Pristionchus mayeri]GMR58138.1 hypothetical protein PMAYCL1PPCAC_28333 [Pristionchus mayeri]GMR59189.1 hypothetical protein PMAYCL1PPCAC_29384 [Pristionchus mayeri]